MKGPIKFKGLGTESDVRLLEDTTEWCVEALASQDENKRAIAVEILQNDKHGNVLYQGSARQDHAALVLSALRKAEGREPNARIKAKMQAAILKLTPAK